MIFGTRKIYIIFKIGHSDSYRQDFKVAASIKFRFFNCRKLQNSYTYSDTKILSKHEKTAIEASLLRFVCGVTGTLYLPNYCPRRSSATLYRPDSLKTQYNTPTTATIPATKPILAIEECVHTSPPI